MHALPCLVAVSIDSLLHRWCERETLVRMARELYLKNPTPPGAAQATSLGSRSNTRNPTPPTHKEGQGESTEAESHLEEAESRPEEAEKRRM